MRNCYVNNTLPRSGFVQCRGLYPKCFGGRPSTYLHILPAFRIQTIERSHLYGDCFKGEGQGGRTVERSRPRDRRVGTP